MRLLHTQKIQLEEFVERNTPKYAILSHRWGKGEVLFEDIVKPGSHYLQKKAWKRKVRGFCQKASEHGYKFVWIDTCCIDKTSSAELSEAINTMYRWYRHSAVCYAYLSDVYGDKLDFSE